MNPHCKMLVMFVALFVCDVTVDTKCFRAFKSCNDPSKNLCALDNPPSLISLSEEFKILYNQLKLSDNHEVSCFNHPVFAFCSWICTGDASCVGLNFFHSRDYVGDPSDYCQLFSDFPQDYYYSDNCSFFTTSTNESDCYSFPLKEWVLIQQRLNDSTSFNQNWISFKNGFGDPLANFWLGLQKVYELTKGISYRVKFEGLTQNGLLLVDEYSSFTLSDEGTGYSILVSGYVGNNTNFMDYAVGGLLTAKCNAAKFSTFDIDNDLNLLENCALTRYGGWWYHSKCDSTNFNGMYSKYFNMLTRSQGNAPLKCSRIFVKQN